MKKLKNVQVLTVSAFLLAIATVLGFLKVPLNPLVELRFAFLPIAVAGSLFGPGIGVIVGMLSDILGYLAKPTGPFFPGFTISSMVSGLLYGAFFYNKKITIGRVVLAELAQSIVISLLINSVNLSILYKNAFPAVLSARVLKTLVMFPINTALLFAVLQLVKRIVPESLKTKMGLSKI